MTGLSKNSAQLLTRENTLSAFLEAIDGAKRNICLVMYMIADDSVGNRVAKALSNAARRGISVRMIYDSVGSWRTSGSFFNELNGSGVKTRAYNPFFGLLPGGFGWQRDHRKFLVVDGMVGFVGGMNLTDKYLAEGVASPIYDFGIAFGGDEARVLEELFEASWRHPTWPLPARKELPSASGQKFSLGDRIRVVSNRFPRRFGIYRNLLASISTATRSIDIVNPYFLPTRRMLQALGLAASKGVKIRVLLPHSTDVWLLDWASQANFKRYMRFGLKVYRWKGFIHAKAIFIDEQWAAIGSFNFDYWSLLSNLEIMVFVREEIFSRELGNELERNFSESSRVTLEEVNQQPLFKRILGKLFYRMKRWL